MDLVFRLHIAVLGNARVDADAGAVKGHGGQPGVSQGLAGAPDSNGPGARPAPNLLALLVAQCVKVTDAGHGLADMTNLVGFDT